MSKIIYSFIALLSFVLILPVKALAIEDPLAKPNNKIGIHVLFPGELSEAAALVNGNGGEWGYVVIPIQKSDRDLLKWQDFMNQAKKHKLIPIVRLATDGDYFNTSVWRTPREEDLLDFANFLNSLNWPVKNRYIIVFNEVNRDDEWGGKADPAEYARLLSYGNTVFKSLSPDYFVISAGMDNASINGNGAINQFDYMRAMNAEVPGIFNQVDGISSHAYPNPAFSSHPRAETRMSISSFKFERELAESLSNKKLPVFITETGWDAEALSPQTVVDYYSIAFAEAWSDPGIVTIAPFLLRAEMGPFQKFTFLKSGGNTLHYEAIRSMTKTKGKPTLNKDVLGETSTLDPKNLMTKTFSDEFETDYFSRSEIALETLKFFFGL